MPAIDVITRILSDMDTETYDSAVNYIYYLVNISERKNSDKKSQLKFIDETAGKIRVDEDAINLRKGYTRYVKYRGFRKCAVCRRLYLRSFLIVISSLSSASIAYIRLSFAYRRRKSLHI